MNTNLPSTSPSPSPSHSLTSSPSSTPITLGLAVCQGTGPELAAIFRRVVEAFARAHAVDIRVEQSPRVYETFHSLRPADDPPAAAASAREDAAHYEAFCRSLARAGVPAIFRTAMNAQSLYLVRERLRAAKIERLQSGNGDGNGDGDLDLLLVRDQAQGFYAGDNLPADDPDLIVRNASFSREITNALFDLALDEARRVWAPAPIDRVIMAYKFHILDGRFARWVADLSRRHGVPIELGQPDTVNRNIIAEGLKGRVLILAANEWGDIMHVVLLDRLNLGRQESRHTRNVFLDPECRDLAEYQTVHGSADDLAGTGRVDPTATLRAAAAMVERHANCEGAVDAMEAALRKGLAANLLRANHLKTDLHQTDLLQADVLAAASTHIPSVPHAPHVL